MGIRSSGFPIRVIKKSEKPLGFLPHRPGQTLPDAGIRRPERRTGARRRRAVRACFPGVSPGRRGKRTAVSLLLGQVSVRLMARSWEARPGQPGGTAASTGGEGPQGEAARTVLPGGSRRRELPKWVGPGRKTGCAAGAEGAPGPHSDQGGTPGRRRGTPRKRRDSGDPMRCKQDLPGRRITAGVMGGTGDLPRA